MFNVPMRQFIMQEVSIYARESQVQSLASFHWNSFGTPRNQYLLTTQAGQALNSVNSYTRSSRLSAQKLTPATFLLSMHTFPSWESHGSQVAFVCLLIATSPGILMGSLCTCVTCSDPAHCHRPHCVPVFYFSTAEQTSRDTCQRMLQSLFGSATSLNPLILS